MNVFSALIMHLVFFFSISFICNIHCCCTNRFKVSRSALLCWTVGPYLHLNDITFCITEGFISFFQGFLLGFGLFKYLNKLPSILSYFYKLAWCIVNITKADRVHTMQRMDPFISVTWMLTERSGKLCYLVTFKIITFQFTQT